MKAYPNEVNALHDPRGYHREVTGNIKRSVPWTEPGLTVHRLRLVSDPGFPLWDVSYCHGRLPDGEYVRVELPFDQLPKRGLERTIVQHAKRDGVYAKGMGIFAAISKLW